MHKLLVINPGSTSTKIAIYEGGKANFSTVLRHKTEELDKFSSIYDQYQFRKDTIIETLKSYNIDLSKLSAVVGRGGAIRPLQGGTYRVNQQMLDDCRSGYTAQHAANLGAVIAHEIADERNIPAFVVDPPVVDELSDLARVTGLPNMTRHSLFHALNQKATARRAAEELGKSYEESRLIVAHLGGGISIGAHLGGKVVDVNNCYDSEGPLMPERSGTLPIGAVVKMCFSGEYTQDQIKKMLTGKGGIVAHLGTNDMRDVNKMIQDGDKHAELIYRAMAYQTAKAIGSRATVLIGQVDAIVITGGVAYDENLVNLIKERVTWIAPVKVYPGGDEMEALAQGAERILMGVEQAKDYDESTMLGDVCVL
ncbi:MAG: butyrate kinase [Deltaproteobacteria bacterium]|nr:butyrate kinase [Deltaproteobacteria bacterium]